MQTLSFPLNFHGDPFVILMIKEKLNDLNGLNNIAGVQLLCQERLAEYTISQGDAFGDFVKKYFFNGSSMKIFFKNLPTEQDQVFCQAAAYYLQRLLKNTLFLRKRHISLMRYMLGNLFVKDTLTYIHLWNVQKYANILGASVGLDKQQMSALTESALLHDVGKLAISNTILKSRVKLTPDDMQIMRKHPYYGFEYLLAYPEFAGSAYIAFYHHERWDGNGYPYGLAGEDIPLEARILAIADTFDAMTGQRLYRSPWGIREALEELKEQAGTQFDPRLTDLFIRLLKRKGEE